MDTAETVKHVYLNVTAISLFLAFCIGFLFGLLSIVGAMCLRIPLMEVPLAQIALHHVRRAQDAAEQEATKQETAGEPTEEDLTAGGGHFEKDPETGESRWVRREAAKGSSEF